MINDNKWIFSCFIDNNNKKILLILIMEMSFFIYLISIFKFEFNGYHLIFRAIQLNFPKKKKSIIFVLINYLMNSYK